MAAGDILSCEVLATGWQAKVVIDDFKDGGTYDFGDIDADVANATFVMTVVSEGYNTSGTLGTITRTVYGTRVCQKAYPNQATAEETEAAGDVELTIALSDYVYDDDNTGAGKSGTAPTVSISAGWYTDNGTGGSSAASNAATNLAVTNSSTQDYPKVVARWAVVPYQRVTSTFDLEAVAFHRFAQNGKPVACVKFTHTDGTTDAAYETAMVKSSAADSLPCYRRTITASDYTDNTAYSWQFTAYPWVGDADSVITTVGGSANALTLGPLPLLMDPDDDYGVTHACVNTSTGSDSGTKAFSSLASAQASPCATIRYALAQIQSYNNTNYSRNNANAGMIYLQSNNHSINGTGTATVGDVWVTITRDPDVSKANACIIGNPNADLNTGAAGRTRYHDITFIPTGYMLAGNSRTLWMDSVSILPASQLSNELATGFAITYYTFCDTDKLSAPFCSFSTANQAGLVRGCASTLCKTPAKFARAVLTSTFNHNHAQTGSLQLESTNIMVAYTRVLADPSTGSNTFDIDVASATGDAAVVCNIVEKTANTSGAFTLYSGTTTPSTNNVLVWHNTVAGERSNLGYNNSTGRSMSNFSLKFNSFQEFNTKHDVFETNGARVEGWSMLYGVGWDGNNGEDSNFDGYYWGRNGTINTPAQYVDDNSFTTAGTGNGDYTPNTGSPLIGKITRAVDVVIPWDINGVAYAAGGCSGAITLAAGQPTAKRLGGILHVSGASPLGYRSW